MATYHMQAACRLRNLAVQVSHMPVPLQANQTYLNHSWLPSFHYKFHIAGSR